jgi:aspartyl-tRNA(Asn)/glutamyl-tRNA(Gln) amidotransferase subunit A
VTEDVVIHDDMSTSSALWAEFFAYHKDLISEKAGLYQAPLRKVISGFDKGAAISGADYIITRKRIEALRREAPALFKDFDLLVMPTWSEAAIPIAERIRALESKEERPPKLWNTSPFNVLGLPAITVPCGFTRAGLPVGLQIAGPPLAESRVLALAHAFEQTTQWHLRKARLEG